MSASVNEPDRTWTYAEIAERAGSVRELYVAKKIRLHRDSALGKLLRDAECLAADWDSGTESGGMRRVLNAAHANRVTEAIQAVRDEPAAQEALRRIAGNSVNLSLRDPSQGKDALWELELLSFLRRRGISARLVEPPDIVLDIGFGDYGIACKKVYSERGVQAQMRKGCAQLTPFAAAGMVALNIDDLVPEDSLLQSRTNVDAAEFLARLNLHFVERNRIMLQRFVMQGRCDGIIISTSTLSDIASSRVRLNTISQTTLWTVDGASTETRARVEAMRRALYAERDG